MTSSALLHDIGRAVVHSWWIGAAACGVLAIARQGAVSSRARRGVLWAGLGLIVLGPIGLVWSEVVAAAAPAAAPVGSAASSMPFVRPLGALWLAAVAWRLARAFLARRALRRLEMRARLPGPRACAAFEAASRVMGTRRGPRLLVSDAVSVPMTWGAQRAVVLLPGAVEREFDASTLEPLIMHELAHVGRGDYTANLLQHLLETPSILNPAAGWIGRRLREEREHACDAAVTARTRDVVGYVRSLTELEVRRVSGLAGAARAFAVPAACGSLLQRVSRLAGERPATDPRRMAAAAAITVAAIFAGFGAGALAAQRPRGVTKSAVVMEVIDDPGLELIEEVLDETPR